MAMATDGRVAEWVARKARREADPLEALARGDTSALRRDAGHLFEGALVASVAGRVVARSSQVRTASGRLYFPAEDCVAEHFAPSPKRWT